MLTEANHKKVNWHTANCYFFVSKFCSRAYIFLYLHSAPLRECPNVLPPQPRHAVCRCRRRRLPKHFAPEEPDEKEPAPHTEADTHCRHGIDVCPDRPSFGTVRLFYFSTSAAGHRKRIGPTRKPYQRIPYQYDRYSRRSACTHVAPHRAPTAR